MTEESVDYLKTLGWDVAVKVVLSRLFAATPFLFAGPLGVLLAPVVTFIATWVTDKLYAALKEMGDMGAILIRNEAHRAQFDRASSKLYIIARGKGLASKEYKDARNLEQDALSVFVKFGG